MSVRCKVRCISILYHADEATEIRFLPVVPKCPAYPDGCDENKLFWDATPSGEVKLYIRNGFTFPYNLGAFYYIDLRKSGDETEGRPWKLWEVTSREGCTTINMGLGWSPEAEVVHASLEMGMNNQGAEKHFYGQSGTKWSVLFSEA